MGKMAIQIHPNDNVAVILCDLAERGSILYMDNFPEIHLQEDIRFGHKVALQAIRTGEKIYKYGFAIGIATADIQPGEWVHAHNLKTALREDMQYSFSKDTGLVTAVDTGTFMGYARANGDVGVRNEIWILPMVSCVNHTGKLIAEEFRRRYPQLAGGVYALEQPFGCSQLGQDHAATVRILADIALHPNAGGVILLSLGCENNVMDDFLLALGKYDSSRIRPLIAQRQEDEIEAGVCLLKQLCEQAQADRRTRQPLSKLRVGFKCGASDGFSGITANPLAGKACEKLVSNGAATVMTEVPEMFGAETILMNHARDRDVFERLIHMIDEFKHYYTRHHQPIYENPSPGNKEGGITTLEEKSLGCIQKGGFCEVEDILEYGGRVRRQGLSLLSAPGNDPVSITAMAAAGCQVLVFTTGRGNPLGSIVPTLKVASNSTMAARKQGWIDLDAGSLLQGADMDSLGQALYELVLQTANGEYITKSERSGYKEIGIFKNGVTL